jgi:hypothetical protein
MRQLLLSFASSLVLVGCISAPLRLQTPTLDQRAQAMQLLQQVEQQEILVDKPDVNGGGGILGAIIEGVAESNMDKNRQAALVPIRNALVDFNFEQKFFTAARAAFDERLLSPEAKITTARNIADVQDFLVTRNDGSTVSVNLNYHFQQDFRALSVTTIVRLGDLGLRKNSRGKLEEKYYSDKQRAGKMTYVVYTSNWTLEKSSGSYTPNIERWMANNGEKIKVSLDRSILEITDLIQRDLPNPIAHNPKAKQRKVENFLPIFQSSGELVERKGDRALIIAGPFLTWVDAHALR